MPARRSFFLAGLLLTTSSTLTLEMLDTRLLSVVTWYHLSFFAVSMAMFGMAAGAVHVFLGGERFRGAAAPRALARHAWLFAASIPLSNMVNLCIAIPSGKGAPTLIATFATSLVLAVPFFLSGVVVAIALTRIPGPSGLVYAVDLLGAALGGLAVLAVFELSSITSSALVVGAVAAAGAFAFSRFAAEPQARWRFVGCVALLALAAANELGGGRVGVIWAKGQYQDPRQVFHQQWTLHGQVVARHSLRGDPAYWGPGRGADQHRAEVRVLVIDGAASTSITRWDGRTESLVWVRHDVTSLPYHLRRGGDNAVIGVGGGRDILTALWGGSRSVTGIEINEAFLHLLEGPLRDYARLADDPRVSLVHDEARSYLTRSPDRFDVLQMSLIDTWAATGAGAFTLSENGLYTLEAWETFLDVLAPCGVFSVSRWYSPGRTSETSRLLALATATLLERGVERPEQHVLLAAVQNVATLLVSTCPFGAEDLGALDTASKTYGFRTVLSPAHPPDDALLASVVTARSRADIDGAISGLPYDYSPPSDDRPYFFNILRPRALGSEAFGAGDRGVIAEGNLMATLTLAILFGVACVGVLAVVIGPLARSGLPAMSGRSFALSCLYFVSIGAGFMFVQIPLMQRFSVYLGHPTYAVAVILPSMILATGLGSYWSDRLDLEGRPRWLSLLPLGIAANLLLWTLALQPLIDGTLQGGLGVRILVVSAVVSCAALPLGVCFPLGLRLVRRISEDALPWMWGVNGAASVLASVAAVVISMWAGISVTLGAATACYALLALPVVALWRAGTPER